MDTWRPERTHYFKILVMDTWRPERHITLKFWYDRMVEKGVFVYLQWSVVFVPLYFESDVKHHKPNPFVIWRIPTLFTLIL